jgi:AcrR family transcriptional regulator
MEKVKNSLAWIEEGYHLFAQEGLDGIQVERLARILQFNKSGFYHYFGDIEGFSQELIKMHERKVDHFIADIHQTKVLDPDYLHLLVEHSVTVMFQVQLSRRKDNHAFYALHNRLNDLAGAAVLPLWSDYLGVDFSSDVAWRYFNIVRDMFHTRISFKNLNFGYLHQLVTEVKSVADDLGKLEVVEYVRR